jgi:Ca-activated chloride channel homolog
VLKRLARETGGAAYFPFRSSEAASICARIAREIRDQYTLGYVPSAAAPPGSYRRIRVTASAAGKGKLTVRSRAGYYRVAAPKKDVR